MLHVPEELPIPGEPGTLEPLDVDKEEYGAMREALEERLLTTPLLYFIASNDTPFILETLSVNYRLQASGVRSRVTPDGRNSVVAILLPEWLLGIDRAVPVNWEIRPADRIPRMEVRLSVRSRAYRIGAKANVEPPYWSGSGRIHPQMVREEP